MSLHSTNCMCHMCEVYTLESQLTKLQAENKELWNDLKEVGELRERNLRMREVLEKIIENSMLAGEIMEKNMWLAKFAISPGEGGGK